MEEVDLDQSSSLLSLFNPHKSIEISKLKIDANDKNLKDVLKASNSTKNVETKSVNMNMKEESSEKLSSLISLLGPQNQIKESKLKKIAIDESLKKNLKMRNSILRDISTSAEQELRLPKNDSLSFGALYSYLFQN